MLGLAFRYLVEEKLIHVGEEENDGV